MVLEPRAPDEQFGSTEVISLLFFVPVPAGMGYPLGIRPFLAAGNATPDQQTRVVVDRISGLVQGLGHVAPDPPGPGWSTRCV